MRHKGWGESVIIGVAGGAEEENRHPAFYLVTGRAWRGSTFRGVKVRSQLPGIVDTLPEKRISVQRFYHPHHGF